MSIDIKLDVNTLRSNNIAAIFRIYRDIFEVQNNFLDEAYIRNYSLNYLRIYREFTYTFNRELSRFRIIAVESDKLKVECQSFPEDPGQEKKELRFISALQRVLGNSDKIKKTN